MQAEAGTLPQDCNKHHAPVFVAVVVIILGIRGIVFSPVLAGHPEDVVYLKCTKHTAWPQLHNGQTLTLA
jgi:hypothetical protein